MSINTNYNSMNITSDNPSSYKLKLCSKKLQSGKFQVKFYASKEEEDLYGYVLVDAKDTLKEVVNTIKLRLHLMDEANDYYQTHLYAVRKLSPPKAEFMIFKS